MRKVQKIFCNTTVIPHKNNRLQVVTEVKQFIPEEKRSFIEMQLKEQMYNKSHKPTIVGKLDENGKDIEPSEEDLKNKKWKWAAIYETSDDDRDLVAPKK